MRKAGAGARGHTEASGGHPETGGDIFLWLEQDDMDLRSKKATQHHRATQTHRDAHCGGLNLRGYKQIHSKHYITAVAEGENCYLFILICVE